MFFTLIKKIYRLLSKELNRLLSKEINRLLSKIINRLRKEINRLLSKGIKGIKMLKSGSHLPKNIFFICLNDSPLTMMKNAFYFILKALFVFKIFEFLSWLFGHVEKTAWLERQD